MIDLAKFDAKRALERLGMVDKGGLDVVAPPAPNLAAGGPNPTGREMLDALKNSAGNTINNAIDSTPQGVKDGAGWLGRNALAGVALAPAAAIDVLNKGVNGVNALLGGSDKLLATDHVASALDFANPSPEVNKPWVAAPKAALLAAPTRIPLDNKSTTTPYIDKTGGGMDQRGYTKGADGVWTPTDTATASGVDYGKNVSIMPASSETYLSAGDYLAKEAAGREALAKSIEGSRSLGDILAGIRSNNTTWDLSAKEQLAMANTRFGAQEERAKSQAELEKAAKTADSNLAGTKYTADQGIEREKVAKAGTLESTKLTVAQQEADAKARLEGTKYTADQGLKGHEVSARALVESSK